jgi:hypothetical protein
MAEIAESRSSYNGLLIFLFISWSALLAAYVIHRLASHAVRRAPAWGCGFLDLSPATQYTAGSFAQPIRRVFGTYLFRAREHVAMPPPVSLAATLAPLLTGFVRKVRARLLRDPYVVFATTWVAAALVPTFATGLIFSWSADLTTIIAITRASLWRLRGWT